ncbi:MAG: alpha/beta hydrolase [Myxococcota bacterium]
MQWLAGATLLVLLPVVVFGVSVYVVAVYAAWTLVWLGGGRRDLPAHPVRAFVVELFCVTAVVLLSARALGRRLERLHDGRPGAVPVLCVHGYTQNLGNWVVMSSRLARGGTGAVYGINLRPKFVELEVWAAQIVDALRQIQRETGATHVDVVCHSMGGLATRLALARHGADVMVRRVVTLGSPHRGTVLAPLGLGANAAQMRVGCAFLTGLPEGPATLTSIWSTCDGMVLPVDHAVWGGRQVVFHDLGHLSLLFSPRVAHATVEALTAPEAALDVTSAPAPSLAIA